MENENVNEKRNMTEPLLQDRAILNPIDALLGLLLGSGSSGSGLLGGGLLGSGSSGSGLLGGGLLGSGLSGLLGGDLLGSGLGGLLGIGSGKKRKASAKKGKNIL